MANFDPALRHEIWNFVRRPSPNRGFNRHKRLERLKFNTVYYDDGPDGYVEPVSASTEYPGLGTDSNVNIARQGQEDGADRCIGFEYFDFASQPCDGCQQFD